MPSRFTQAGWRWLAPCVVRLKACSDRLMRLLTVGSLFVLAACTSAGSAGMAPSQSTSASPAAAPKVRISTWTSPQGHVHEVAIWRPAALAPAGAHEGPGAEAMRTGIERVYVVPGSGCTGMAPILPGYFEGLAAREFIVLHKHHVQASDWPRPSPCRAGFVEHDELAAWLRAWRAFLTQDLRERPVPHGRVLLVGISEGAELLPGLMAEVPDLGMAVLLASTGLDPWEALRLQLKREGDLGFAQAVEARLAESMPALDGTQADSAASPNGSPLLGGRTLNHWRTLRHWPVAQPLQESQVRALVLLGSADPVQAPEGLERLAHQHSRPGLCARLVAGADHGLRVEGHQWPGMWPLVQGLWQAEGQQAFARRCAQPD